MKRSCQHHGQVIRLSHGRYSGPSGGSRPAPLSPAESVDAMWVGPPLPAQLESSSRCHSSSAIGGPNKTSGSPHSRRSTASATSPPRHLSLRSTMSSASRAPANCVRGRGSLRRAQLRHQGPPRPHLKAGLGVGALGNDRSRPCRQEKAPLCRTLRHDRAPAGQEDRHVAIARKLLTKCYFVLKQVSERQTQEAGEVSAPGELDATMV